eukprot:c23715_g3_i1 orf=62-391(+)
MSSSNMGGNVWQSFQKNFNQVQHILDQNCLLINEINKNHESKVPECLTRNVGLIRELNNNIGKVVDLYAGLSSTLTNDATPPEGEVLNSATPSTVNGDPLYSGKRLRSS